MKFIYLAISFLFGTRLPAQDAGENHPIAWSQEFLYGVRTGDSISNLKNNIAEINPDSLLVWLDNDEKKMAFWLNLYNGFTQETLTENSEKYQNRRKFFSDKFISVAGAQYSLDDIEHGILRRSKIKWSLGYFGKLFPSKNEKQLRVDKLDYRIHFALNCGAKSCPPIAYYSPEKIDLQLDMATKAYLQSESEYDSVKNILYLPAIMGWFRRDFGGKRKMLALAEQLSILPEGKKPKLKFKKYDWSLYLQNYNQ